jgi:hypothetical protein
VHATVTGAMVVVAGAAGGRFCSFFTPPIMFRVDSAGVRDSAFKPAFAGPNSHNADVALGVRADGRLLYGTTEEGRQAVIFQQALPDGAADSSFGANGKVTFPLAAGETSRTADLVVLGDGSVVLAIMTSRNLILYKVDARGAPVASFGIAGQFTYPMAIGDSVRTENAVSLLSLPDGSFFAAIGVDTNASVSVTESLLAIRISENGVLTGAAALLAEEKRDLHWRLAALPDASVLIARSLRDGTTSSAALYRLLPDNSLDASFGVGGAYPLLGVLSVDALALDADERLLVAGQDATSAILARMT